MKGKAVAEKGKEIGKKGGGKVGMKAERKMKERDSFNQTGMQWGSSREDITLHDTQIQGNSLTQTAAPTYRFHSECNTRYLFGKEELCPVTLTEGDSLQPQSEQNGNPSINFILLQRISGGGANYCITIPSE